MEHNVPCRVSVLMPTYNYGTFIAEAIDSVLAQTFQEFELLVVDNCSTDDTGLRVQRYVAKDSRVRYIRNEANLGMVGNWNRCLSHARGDYIKFMFSDDTFLASTALELMVEQLDSDASIALVASARVVIDADSRKLEVLSYKGKSMVCDGHAVIRECIVEQKNRIGEPSAVLFRRQHGARGFDARYRQIVDLEMWFHLLEQGKLAYLREPLVSFRVHPQQQTQQNRSDIGLIEEPFLLLHQYGTRPYVNLPWQRRTYMRYLPVYSVWKLYRQHRKIDRKEALAVIKEKFGLPWFIALYPLFKLYKAYLRRTQPA